MKIYLAGTDVFLPDAGLSDNLIMHRVELGNAR
jgi:hypothetical protein